MAKLPSSFRARNRTTRSFREQYARLPAHIQELVRGACVLYDANPNLSSFRRHELKEIKKGHHRVGSISITPTMQYRALYFEVDGVNEWYWIGTHADYKRFTGSPR
jgi:hypothetical protein